ncbi:MAG: hypothetical protein IH840_09240 [Candidatus Heimdallarchaeota archaeon]|nr:hypothetical protein [Candidatus Heimdallarchaeota archaeon]
MDLNKLRSELREDIIRANISILQSWERDPAIKFSTPKCLLFSPPNLRLVDMNFDYFSADFLKIIAPISHLQLVNISARHIDPDFFKSESISHLERLDIVDCKINGLMKLEASNLNLFDINIFTTKRDRVDDLAASNHDQSFQLLKGHSRLTYIDMVCELPFDEMKRLLESLTSNRNLYYLRLAMMRNYLPRMQEFQQLIRHLKLTQLSFFFHLDIPFSIPIEFFNFLEIAPELYLYSETPLSIVMPEQDEPVLIERESDLVQFIQTKTNLLSKEIVQPVPRQIRLFRVWQGLGSTMASITPEYDLDI